MADIRSRARPGDVRPSTEILVNFMFEEINRFINHPDQGHNFDGLFGCEEWRLADCRAGRERKKFIVDLYREQLSQRAGARHVRSFEMRNQRNTTDYFLFFAGNNRLGLSKMKEAMWKVTPAAVIHSPMPQISDRMSYLGSNLIVTRYVGL